jgi:outer membrane protein
MNKLSNILSILSFIGVCILGFLHFKGGKSKAVKQPKQIVVKNDSGQVTTSTVSGSAIAYVDLDTLEVKYDVFKKKMAEFDAKDKNLGAELERMATAIQNEYIDLQKKAQAGQINQEQGEALQKKLLQKQQDLETKKQNQGTQLLKEQEDFNEKIQDNLRGFLKDYAAEKGYEYVFAYTKANSILFADEANNVTDDVLVALNSGKTFTEKKK